MSDPSLKRQLLLAVIVTFAASALLAANPSARYETRMVYDAKRTSTILFGGLTAVDSGTKKAYHLGDTWEWTGSRWIERFPLHSPPARSSQAMVYDSNRAQVVMFGGRGESADLNDTWVYKSADWTLLETPNAPPARMFPAAAFDPLRDRMIVFGGTQTSADGKTLTPVHDTWEFDGTTWKQIGGDGPSVSKPILVYDAARNQVLMLALDDQLATVMYSYDPAAGAWNQLKPTTLPPCVNEGVLAYQSTDQTVLYTGGVCATAAGTDETYTWDGENWTKLELKSAATRLFGAALAFDETREVATLFGGTPPFGAPESTTWLYGSSAWIAFSDTTQPGPRSLFALSSDPVNNTIWMFGGIDESTTLDDFWQYQNGVWQAVAAEKGPSGCLTPTSAFDTDRQKLVLVCSSSDTFEWDGTAWKKFEGLKTIPPLRRFSSMTYDPTLKKTVLFGGFDGTNYLDETWLWDGASWSREKRNPAPARSLTSMWYDPTLKKIVIYGGIGRVNSQDRITRYSDTWTFDGNGWTELKPAGGTPGTRYGAQVTVDPRSNHALLFGGLRVDTTPPTPPATTPIQVQLYADDMWEWDGSAWARLNTNGIPPARENGAMAFDPTRNEIVLFGGYAGHFFSDLWTYNPTTWRVRVIDPAGGRRRVVQ